MSLQILEEKGDQLLLISHVLQFVIVCLLVGWLVGWLETGFFRVALVVLELAL